MTMIHWFRRDLRLTDNTAWQAAQRSGESVIPLFVLDPALLASRYVGAHRLTFLWDALRALDRDLRAQGGALIIRRGDPAVIIPQLAAESGARAVYASRDYSPYARRRDRRVEMALSVPLHCLDDALLVAPEAIAKTDGTPYTVYTPFKKQWLAHPKPAPDRERVPYKPFDQVPLGRLPELAEYHIMPVPDLPLASETEAQRRLAQFVAGPIFRYGTRRDLLAEPGTSVLSPYLRFGLLSVREVYAAVLLARAAAPDETAASSVDTWLSELAWREFYVHILYHFPHVRRGNFRAKYDGLIWRNAPDELDAWQNGLTGYPVVDAGMRQLRQTGWMHNRARMITASFLTRHLLIDWREGERFFMQYLIDGDPAANNGGWQWVAGTGTDAQPYFRIFNPVTQGRKFDPVGEYVRRWVSELGGVPARYIHTPWKMPTPLAAYPAPIVDHALARARALAAFEAIKTPLNS